MAKKFSDLVAKMPPEARARARAKTQDMLAALPLDELREARELTQEHLAKILNKDQSAVSKMERRADMYVSTLQDFVKAMGGELEICAVFPEGKVRISQFAHIPEPVVKAVVATQREHLKVKASTRRMEALQAAVASPAGAHRKDAK